MNQPLPDPPLADTGPGDTAPAPNWPGWVAATAKCLRFYSRLSIPRMPGEGDPHAVPDFRVVVRALPIAGGVLGLIGAAVLLAASALDFPATLGAFLAVAAMVLTTGAFHEDGIADVADGFWGGATRERRLEIMKDSRVGAFGATALILAIGLRVTALAALVGLLGPVATALALVGASALSRALGLVVLHALPPVRSDGASAAVGQPTRGTIGIALGLSLLICAPFLAISGGPALALPLGLMAAAAVTYAVITLSRAKIQGQTGDVAGAVQQMAEIAFYLGILACGR